MRLKTQFAALAVAAAAATVGLAGPAQAADTITPVPPTVQQVVTLVLGSSDPDAAYAALTPAEQAMFDQSQTQLTGVTTMTSGPEVPVDESLADNGQANPASSGCWYRYWYTVWSNWGFKEGATWMRLNWCGNSTKITSHSLGTHGGKVIGLGMSYDGIAGTGGSNVGWEYRQYVEFKFTFGIDGHGIHATPCMQIRGGHTGLYSERRSCNLS